MADEPQSLAAEVNAEERVLLVPPTPRDADAIRSVLSSCGIECLVFGTLPALCRALGGGAGALVVSEEALAADAPDLLACIAGQPVWSDLPIIVLSRSGSESPKLTSLLARMSNVSVVERPVRISTFLSIVRVALRGRARQYQVREHLARAQSVERERTALWEAERAARAEAERVGRMKDEFLATLSHEIRTPLNAILGWTAVLGRRPARDESEIAKGLAVIERNARAQAQIVEDLLDMNRIVNGKVRLDVQRIAIARVVQAAIDTITPAATAKDVQLHVALDSSTGPVSGDPDRLQQVFWNLLSNAVKFTPQGQSIRVVLERVNSHVEISVIDTGEGIAPDFLPYVFDRFRQADGSTTRRYGGLGLGLAIVKQLVELHGGSVRARSAGLGKGSSFTVALPLAGAHSDVPLAPQHAKPARAAPLPLLDSTDDIADVSVLVVDDDCDSLDVVKRLLEGRRARVTTAASASEAMALLREAQVDVLISDIGMPGQDGYSFVREARTFDAARGRNTVAIALTAYARAEDRVNAMRAGFQYHIAKPVEPTELVAVVASAARRKASAP